MCYFHRYRSRQRRSYIQQEQGIGHIAKILNHRLVPNFDSREKLRVVIAKNSFVIIKK